MTAHSVESTAIELIMLGLMLLLGLAADMLGRRTRVPRVTLLVLCGLLLGPAGMGWIEVQESPAFDLVGTLALVMVGFLLGGKLCPDQIAAQGRAVLQLSLSVVGVTVICVGGGLIALGIPWPLALVLAGIATSTDPIATIDVLDSRPVPEQTRSLLKAVVAIDDAWGLIVFSLLAGIAVMSLGDQGWATLLGHSAWEIAGAILLGVVLGLPMGLMSGRVQPGEPTLVEALGIIMLVGGLAMWLGVSFLLASMVLGMVVALVGRHHRYAFHEIEHIEWPIMVLFFIMAGASLQFEEMAGAGLLGVAFALLRVAGRWLGGALAYRGGAVSLLTGGWLGLALLPQAGIALGAALLAGLHLPEYRETIMAVTVAATVAFELIGPPVTAIALRQLARAEP